MPTNPNTDQPRETRAMHDYPQQEAMVATSVKPTRTDDIRETPMGDMVRTLYASVDDAHEAQGRHEEALHTVTRPEPESGDVRPAQTELSAEPSPLLRDLTGLRHKIWELQRRIERTTNRLDV